MSAAQQVRASFVTLHISMNSHSSLQYFYGIIQFLPDFSLCPPLQSFDFFLENVSDNSYSDICNENKLLCDAENTFVIALF